MIGLIYYHGLYGMNDHSFNILFSDKAKLPIFSFTMSRESMKFLLSTLTFDNPEERKEKCPYDLFAAARSINERFNSNTSKYLLPFLYLSISQNLLSQIVFRKCSSLKHTDMVYFWGLYIPYTSQSLLMLVNHKKRKGHTKSVQ